MDIERISYRKYQWNWLMSHNYLFSDLVDIANEWLAERLSNSEYEDSLSEFIYEYGFHGELWACFDEFLSTEFQDKEFMKRLLSEDEYAEYLKNGGISNDIHNNSYKF